MTANIKRGDVVLVDLRGAEGHEKMDQRPCIVVQNDVGNRMSPLTIVVPLTDARQFKNLPVQVQIAAAMLGPKGKDSVAECGHIRTVDVAARIKLPAIAHLDDETMKKIDAALRSSLNLN